MSPVVLEELLEPLSRPAEPLAPALPLSFREIGAGYRTACSFGYSDLLHQLAFVLVLFFSHYAFVGSVQSVSAALETATPMDKTLDMPVLGGSEGAGKQGGGSSAEQQMSTSVRARSRRVLPAIFKDLNPNALYYVLKASQLQ